MKKSMKIQKNGILVKIGSSEPKLCFYDSGKFGWCNVRKQALFMIKSHAKMMPKILLFYF